MASQKTMQIVQKVFIGFSVMGLLYVSVLSLFDPQATMALVQVELGNNDAISSIRGIYGGVGMAISASLIYLMMYDRMKALMFLVLFWGMYAFSRFLTIVVNGPLGDFGTQWLTIETVFFVIALGLVGIARKKSVQ